MTKTESEDLKNRKKLKKRVIIGLVVFLLAVILGGLVFLHTGAFESFLLEKATRYLEANYNLSLTVESFDVTPLRLAIDLDTIEILPDANKESPIQHFTAQKFKLNLAFSIAATSPPSPPRRGNPYAYPYGGIFDSSLSLKV